MKRILIVDDALDLGRLLQTVFLTLDPTLSINVVPSAEEALMESTRKPLDLLVSDIRLPGMSGFELVKKIRTRHPAIKVLFITGLTDPNVPERASEMNAEGFFRKPLDMTSFLNAARKCLDLPAESPLMPLRSEASLVQTAFSNTPLQPSAAAPFKDASPELLSDLVAGLRQRLGALAVFVLDERGRIVVQAGNVPALPLEEQWAGPVMAALSSAHKVARLVGDGRPRHVMAFPGKEIHLVLAPAGNYALLVLLRPGRSVLRMALAVEEALEAQQMLGETLASLSRQTAPAAPVEAKAALPSTAPLPSIETPVLAEPPAPEVSPAAIQEEQSLADFEAVLKQSAGQLKEKDVNAFWDTASSHGQPGTTVNPDVLSYDQARKLGLTPKDAK